MAPRRELTGKVNYQERNICDDFLEQLTMSTNAGAKAKELVPKNPRLRIGDGLYDKGNWLRDPEIGVSGLGLFKVGFGQRHSLAPLHSIWELDVGKLMVLGVFMDVDLLTMIAQNYDPIARCIRSVKGSVLIEIKDDELRNVFKLSEASNLLEPIDFESLAQIYNAQRDHLRSGPLKEFFVTIGGLTVVDTSTMEPFSLNLFTLRAKDMYWALCQIFGKDAEKNMPTHYMLMIAQIVNPSLAITFDYASHLTDAIHAALVRINNGKVDRPFGWYSLLMHMFLLKGVDYFVKEMDLVKVKDKEEMPVQLWRIVLC